MRLATMGKRGRLARVELHPAPPSVPPNDPPSRVRASNAPAAGTSGDPGSAPAESIPVPAASDLSSGSFLHAPPSGELAGALPRKAETQVTTGRSLHAPPVTAHAPVASASREPAEAPPRKDTTAVRNVRRADVGMEARSD